MRIWSEMQRETAQSTCVCLSNFDAKNENPVRVC